MAESSDSSWKLLSPWSLTSRKSKDKLKKLSAFRKRIQAHAVIARTLSPLCTRTRLESLVFEESKCFLAFSALLHSCSSCASTAIKDVQVPTNLQSPDEESNQAAESETHHRGGFTGNKVELDSIPHHHTAPIKKEHATRTRQDEKVKLLRSTVTDKFSGGVLMKDAIPVVKYSYDPYLDFHDSMLEMLLERGLKDIQELQEMFCCYVLLNSPRHREHIEKAFRNLLTDLYRFKIVVPNC